MHMYTKRSEAIILSCAERQIIVHHISKNSPATYFQIRLIYVTVMFRIILVTGFALAFKKTLVNISSLVGKSN